LIYLILYELKSTYECETDGKLIFTVKQEYEHILLKTYVTPYYKHLSYYIRNHDFGVIRRFSYRFPLRPLKIQNCKALYLHRNVYNKSWSHLNGMHISKNKNNCIDGNFNKNGHSHVKNEHVLQVFQSTCDIDITYFPFDEQTCELQFQAWSYTTDQVSGYMGQKKQIMRW